MLYFCILGWKQEEQALKDSLTYMVTSRVAWAHNTLFQKIKKPNQTKPLYLSDTGTFQLGRSGKEKRGREWDGLVVNGNEQSKPQCSKA